MGKKGTWFRAVKKVFSLEPKEKKNDQITHQKSKSRWGFKKSKRADPPSSASGGDSKVPAAAAAVAAPPPPPRGPPEQIKLTEADTNHAYSVASAAAAAAEAAVMAAQAAAEVVRLTASSSKFLGKSKEEIAAIKIQTAFRGYQARRALRALRGLLRLRTLMSSSAVKRQTTATLRCVQTLSRVQTQIRSRRLRMLEQNQIIQRQLQLKREKELDALRSSMGEEWDDTLQSKEQIEASILSKKEAAMRRERALAYAFSHQGKCGSKAANPTFTDPGNPQWGWSWAERWTVRSSLGGGGAASRRSSLTPCSSRGRGGTTVDDDTRSLASVQSERARRRSIASSSVRDDESLASSPAVPGYMAPTESARAKVRLFSPEMGSAGSVKKRLSFQAAAEKSQSPSPAAARRHSGPPRVDFAAARNIMMSYPELAAGGDL